MADRKRFNPLDTIPEVLGLYGLLIVVCTGMVGDAEAWSLPDSLWWGVVTVSTGEASNAVYGKIPIWP